MDNHPEVGSRWIYKGDPARLYEVMHITNVAKVNENHPPQVVYRTCSRPDNIWSRSIENFLEVFTPQVPLVAPDLKGKTWRVTVETTNECSFVFTSEYDWPEDQLHRVSREAVRVFDSGRVRGEQWLHSRGRCSYVMSLALAENADPDNTDH